MPTFRSFPKHLSARGRGVITCARSGFLRHPDDVVDHHGMKIAHDKADLTPGFGTDHPQDYAQPEIGGDPSPVPHGGLDVARTKSDLCISDAEILASIREGRLPRRGY